MSYEKVSQAKQLNVGTKQTLKALKEDSVSELIIAEDADPRVVNGAKALATERGIPITKVNSKKELGKACGIEVGAATVAIKN